MSADNGSVTTVQSSKVDRQAWSGSDYATSSSNDFNDYTTTVPFAFPALTSSSQRTTKRIARRVQATISLVEGTSAPTSSSLGGNNSSRPHSFSEGQGCATAARNHLGRPFAIARQDGSSSLVDQSTPQTREPEHHRHFSQGPASGSDHEPDEGRVTGAARPKNMKPTGEVDTLRDDEENFERLIDQYSRLRRKRRDTWEVFDWLRKDRTYLHDIREKSASASHAFMATAQGILPDNPKLVDMYKRMQDSQLEFDSALGRLEERIDEWEGGQLELELEERKFYSLAARPDSVVSSLSGSSISDSASVFTLRGIQSDRPEDIHPLFAELLETFKDLQLAKEFCEDLKLKRRALEIKLASDNSFDPYNTLGSLQSTRTLLAQHYKLMSDEEVEFLEEYDDLVEQSVSDIDSLSKKAESLHIDCLDQDVIPKNSPYREKAFGFDPFFYDDIRLEDPPPSHNSKRPRTLVHSVFHVILSNPIHLLETFPQTPQQSLRMATSLPPSFPARQKFIDDAARETTIHSLIQDADPQNKSDYINRWLLHKLRLSALEAIILYSTFRMRLKIRDLDRWQQDVLEFWTLDQAANLPMQQFQDVSEAPSLETEADTAKPTRHISDSGQLDFIGSWNVDQAWL